MPKKWEAPAEASTPETSEETPPSSLSHEVVDEKIQKIKKRLALKGIITQWDMYYANNQLPLALKKYLEVYEKNPNDTLIAEKIGNTYFDMHKYLSAQKYYKKIQNKTEKVQKKYLMASLYVGDIHQPLERQKFLQALQSENLSDEEIFYYQNSFYCIEDFHGCKIKFQEYFDAHPELEVIWEDVWTGATVSPQTAMFPPLKNITSAIENYWNFQIEDIDLKNAYIVAEWYKDGLYPLASIMGETILTNKPGYRPIIKIIAQSQYNMGNYSQALNTLTDYYELDPNDPEIAYMIAVIQEHERDFLVANIYLSQALKYGYADPSNVYRRQIHNYSLLWDEANMMKTFEKLMTQDDIDAEDASLAVYYSIAYDNLRQAENWARKWQTRFPESGNFYAYLGWIAREQGNLDTSYELLQQWYARDTQNPLLLINLAYTEKAMGKSWAAIIHFKDVLRKYPNSEFATQAQKELADLS